MVFSIHLPTVLLVYKTALAAGAVGIYHVSRHSCRPRGLKPLALAYLLLALGAELAARGEYFALPSWLWTHGSLMLGTVAYPLFWASMRALSGRRTIPVKTLAAIPATLFALGVLTQFPLNNLHRAGAFHATATVALLLSSWDIWRDRRAEPLPSRVPLAAFLLLSACIYALRLGFIVNESAASAGFAWAFYIQMFCHFGIALMVAALSSERASERLEQLAHTDLLTGVGNRRWLASRLPAHLPPDSAVMLIDLDHFKRTNDTYGHAAGDQVLAACAQCLRSQLRESDVLGRMGGEEFVVYLPDATAEAARVTAQRLCDAVARLEVATDAGLLRATVSIGLACVRKAGGSPEQWQQAADQALYEAKRRGRNRVVTVDHLPSPSSTAIPNRASEG